MQVSISSLFLNNIIQITKSPFASLFAPSNRQPSIRHRPLAQIYLRLSLSPVGGETSHTAPLMSHGAVVQSKQHYICPSRPAPLVLEQHGVWQTLICHW